MDTPLFMIEQFVALSEMKVFQTTLQIALYLIFNARIMPIRKTAIDLQIKVKNII